MRPPPIRTDRSNSFANNTMRARLPAIIAETLALNSDYDASIRTRLEKLRDGIASGAPIPPLPKSEPDHHEWLRALDKQREIVQRQPSWHNAEWFFAETYAYRWILEATRWQETGRDPFAPKKHEELQSGALWRLVERAMQPAETLADALSRGLALDLWANRIDLSYAASMQHGTDTSSTDLLVDDCEAAIAHVLGEPDGVIYLVADNAGSELAMDLALVDLLLRLAGIRVLVCLKAAPTFVSDATPSDVRLMLAEMQQRGDKAAALAKRLCAAWSAERLRFLPHTFWNSSHFLWDMPASLHEALNKARLVIIKGDANYRRAVGDCLWDAQTTFAAALSYLDAPTLCLRTLKSDPLVGLPSADLAKELCASDPEWRVNGKRGLIQFKAR
ncbi:MAG: ARMT1-like domain-containing protein [Chloroflexi bacterium]|nr:ARMT1-like domain-containing protein [Chloroflexota bacterium]MCY4246719.1 ARMT1-like domain-containing protein [Chloroflexota bacterium]